MVEMIISFVAGGIVGVSTMMIIAIDGVSSLTEQNERLNRELHKLTDRDERGRFKGGK